MIDALRRILGLKRRRRRRVALKMPAPPPPPPPRARPRTALMPLPPGQIQDPREAPAPPEPEPVAEAESPAARAEALARDRRLRRGAMRQAARARLAAMLGAGARLFGRTARRGLIIGLPLLALATPAFLLTQEMRALGVEVEPFTVPSLLPERGLTAEVVSRRLVDQIDALRRAVLADQAERRPAELPQNLPGFDPPAPRLSLAGIATALRDLAGRPRRRLMADLVLQPDERYALRVYLSDRGQVARIDDIAAAGFDAQIARAAPQIWREVAPRLFAWWLVGHEDRPEVQLAALTGLARDARLDRPTANAVAMLRGRALLRAGRPAEANTLLAELTDRSPDYPPGWAMRAMALAELKREPEALEMMSRARGLDGGYAWSNKMAARLYLRLGRPDDAYGEIRTARRLDPFDGDAMIVEVGALVGIRRLDEAVAAGRAGVARAPAQPGMHDALANALAAAGQPGPALAEIDRELAAFPPTAAALVLRARLLLNLGRFAEALQAAGAALAHMPNAGSALVVRAWALLELGRGPEALAVFEELLRARPDMVTVIQGRALALLALGRKQDALEGLEKTVLLQPDNKRALADLARLKKELAPPG